VVARAFGREVEKEELGGSSIHARGSGAVDNEVESEEALLSIIPRDRRKVYDVRGHRREQLRFRHVRSVPVQSTIHVAPR